MKNRLNVFRYILMSMFLCPLTAFSQNNQALSVDGFVSSDTVFSKPYIDKGSEGF